MDAKARSVRVGRGARAIRVMERDRKPEREARRAAGARKREKENGTDGGEQVGEKGRSSLGGPLLIAAGRGYVPRVIAARVCERGADEGGKAEGPPELSRPEHTAGPVCSLSARGLRTALPIHPPRSFVPRSPAHERRAGMPDGMRTIGRISLRSDEIHPAATARGYSQLRLQRMRVVAAGSPETFGG